MDAKQIGEVIKEARKRKGKTQTALSAVLGIMPLDVLRYETGGIEHIPFEKRAKMSSVLNIPVSELLYDNEEMACISTNEAVDEWNFELMEMHKDEDGRAGFGNDCEFQRPILEAIKQEREARK